jgi:hypothetical protein
VEDAPRVALGGASANHALGRAVTTSETWTWLHSPSFRATPLDVKAEADLHFLQGINQLIGHGWPYTPEGLEYPGARFYAAGVFNDKNPWWPVMPDLARYLQRLSFLLRQGRPANDVALYLPNDDAWASFAAPRVGYMNEALAQRVGPEVIAKVLEAGYKPGLLRRRPLAKVGRLDKNQLVLGEGRYRAVILPNVERIPLATYRKLEAFAQAGGILIAVRRTPDAAPGFLATDAEKAEVRALSARLFQERGGEGPLRARGQGRRRTAERVPEPRRGVLARGHRHRLRAPHHRRCRGLLPRQHEQRAPHHEGHVPGERPARRGLGCALGQGHGTRGLGVGEGPHHGGPRPASVRLAGRGVLEEGSASGRGRAVGPAAAPEPIDLGAGWQVAFGGGAPVAMDRLRSWTEDESTRFFSGIAAYERDVEVPADRLGKNALVNLDFGEGEAIPEGPPGVRHQAWFEGPVREAAVVFVNGERAGAVFCPPYRVDVTALLRPGKNRLRIEVGNTAINHMAGRALPDYRLLNLRYGTRFEPQDRGQGGARALGATPARSASPSVPPRGPDLFQENTAMRSRLGKALALVLVTAGAAAAATLETAP